MPAEPVHLSHAEQLQKLIDETTGGVVRAFARKMDPDAIEKHRSRLNKILSPNTKRGVKISRPEYLREIEEAVGRPGYFKPPPKVNQSDRQRSAEARVSLMEETLEEARATIQILLGRLEDLERWRLVAQPELEELARTAEAGTPRRRTRRGNP